MSYCNVEIKKNAKQFSEQFSEHFLTSIANNITIFDFTKYIKIKLLCNFCNSLDLSILWNKMTKGNFKWNKIQTTKENEIDYYIIINKPLPTDYYIPEKTIVFRMEPDSDLNTTESKMKWDDWYLTKGLNKNDFLFFCDLNRYRNNTEWHLGSTYQQLKEPIVKSKLLSSVVSSLYQMEGHKYRIDLLKYMEKINENKNELSIDIYGRENLFNFKNYRGPLPSHNKDIGILPYKYTIITENCDRINYFTEKLSDAILGETLCFYKGPKNIKDFIDERSYVQLPNDLKESFDLIKKSIIENEYEKRIEYIKIEKQKILNYYNFFPRVENLINISLLEKIIVFNEDHKKEIIENLENNDVRNYNMITDDWKDHINKEKNTLVISGKINTSHFNDKLAIVYSKVLEKKEWDILLLDVGINDKIDREYCEIIKVNENFILKSFIINYKSINKLKNSLIIYKTEDSLIWNQLN